PPGGILLGTQGFDLVVMGPIGASTIGLGRVSFGGIDLTGALAGCAASGPTATLGPIVRCPGVTGAMLESAGTGPHDLTVEADVAGQPATGPMTWGVGPHTEPLALRSGSPWRRRPGRSAVPATPPVMRTYPLPNPLSA